MDLKGIAAFIKAARDAAPDQAAANPPQYNPTIEKKQETNQQTLYYLPSQLVGQYYAKIK